MIMGVYYPVGVHEYSLSTSTKLWGHSGEVVQSLFYRLICSVALYVMRGRTSAVLGLEESSGSSSVGGGITGESGVCRCTYQ